MNRSLFESMVVGSADGPDKVDMSLDDIIRMNKKRNQMQSQKVKLGPLKRPFTPGKKTGLRLGLTLKRGTLVNKRFGLDQQLPTIWARRRGQGLITGLAARKNATLFKGTGLFNQSAQNSPANRQTHSGASFTQRRRPFVQQRQMWRRPGRQMEPHRPQAQFPHRPFRLQRKWNPPSVQQTRRESRQATFLFRRGLKVQAQVQKTHKSQQWHSSTDDNGILTVSIDNPTARSQPEPAQSWSLHPAASSSSPPPKEEPERKPPKGVALQFDINSVGKQTGMTLNERFRILKNQRVAAAHQGSKGGRFVTVA